jgi:hypothetical protein
MAAVRRSITGAWPARHEGIAVTFASRGLTTVAMSATLEAMAGVSRLLKESAT